jgi:hypothetical protein
MKIALAGLAGVGLAWLIPKGGGTPTPGPSVTPSDRPGVTAVEVQLSSIPQGVSFRMIDGVRVFLVRSGSTTVGFRGLATSADGGPIWWCPKNRWFEDRDQQSFYDSKGMIMRYSAPRELDRIRVLVAAGRVTIFPHGVVPGPHATFPPNYAPPLPPPPPPCSAAERVG